MSASVSWSCSCLFSQLQQHTRGYSGVADVLGLLWGQGKAEGAVLTGPSGAGGDAWAQGSPEEEQSSFCALALRLTHCTSFCAHRGFLLCTTLCPSCEPPRARHSSLGVRGAKLCSGSPGTQLPTRLSLCSSFTPSTPKLRANSAAAALGAVICVSHTANAHGEQHTQPHLQRVPS